MEDALKYVARKNLFPTLIRPSLPRAKDKSLLKVVCTEYEQVVHIQSRPRLRTLRKLRSITSFLAISSNVPCLYLPHNNRISDHRLVLRQTHYSGISPCLCSERRAPPTETIA